MYLLDNNLIEYKNHRVYLVDANGKEVTVKKYQHFLVYPELHEGKIKIVDGKENLTDEEIDEVIDYISDLD